MDDHRGQQTPPVHGRPCKHAIETVLADLQQVIEPVVPHRTDGLAQHLEQAQRLYLSSPMRLLTLVSLDNSLKLTNFAIITLFQFVGSMYFSEYKDTTKFWKSVILWAFYEMWETLDIKEEFIQAINAGVVET